VVPPSGAAIPAVDSRLSDRLKQFGSGQADLFKVLKTRIRELACRAAAEEE